MDLSLTPEQKLVQQTANRLAAEVLAPRAAQLDSECGFPTEGLKKLAEAGLLGMLIPPAFGGGGGDTLSYVLVVEEIAKACGSTALAYVSHLGTALAILIGGTPEQKAKYLPAMASGEKIGAFAATEPNSGANSMAVESFAEPHEEYYLLNGSKIFITNAGEAAVYVVLARTGRGKGPQDLSLLLVDRDMAGVSFGKKDVRMGLNGVSSREVVFQDCKIPRSNLVGQEGGGGLVSAAAGGTSALGAAAIAIGLAQAALTASIGHAKTRTILGQPIGAHQAIQFLVSDMSVAVDAARALLNWAVYLKDTSPPGFPVGSFKAKLFAAEMAVDVTNKALQVLGGHGYTKELPVERYYRDARGLTLHFATTELAKELLGKVTLGLFP